MSTDSFELTPNGCAELQANITADEETVGGEQVIQFLSVKKVTGGNDRYRLIISDGIHFIQAMLATQCNGMVEEGTITRFTVALVERASCNLVQGKR
jgi:replication factor A1